LKPFRSLRGIHLKKKIDNFCLFCFSIVFIIKFKNMTHNFDYKSIWDAFTLAASPVAAEGAFDSVRASLDEGHRVKVIMEEGQKPLEFTKRDDFEQWVIELKSKF
jgi:hypothetical protein|tara:strand:+ start:218 stop:532 length:315 start_codon:yes stop_codon:yes gene_type:complete